LSGLFLWLSSYFRPSVRIVCFSISGFGDYRYCKERKKFGYNTFFFEQNNSIVQFITE